MFSPVTILYRFNGNNESTRLFVLLDETIEMFG